MKIKVADASQDGQHHLMILLYIMSGKNALQIYYNSVTVTDKRGYGK